LKTLDHGVGPAITFTRASNATFFDASGVLQTASNDTPRFDHSGSSLGLLIEEARTNQCTNSEASGAIDTNGPTGWFINGTPYNGMTRTITTGTLNGMAYIDVRWQGTTTSGPFAIQMDPRPGTGPAGSTGQAWTSSAYLAIVSGSLPAGSSLNITTRGRDGVGAAIEESNATVSATDSLVRYSTTRTLSNASTTQVTFDIRVTNVPNATAVDFTLRIAAPQLEQGAFATSYIPTTSAAATRAADSAVVTPISSFYNQGEGTLFAEGALLTTASGTFPYSIALDDNTNSNRIELYASTSSSAATVHSSGPSQALLSFAGVLTAGATFRAIVAAKADDLAFSTNGQSVVTDSSALMPVGMTQLRVKPNTFAHIRKIAYWPRRLSNTLLQQLTT
jgi:hypothetical protein